MVIQRWQSLLLLVAAVLMIALNFLPVATLSNGSSFFTTDAEILLIVDGLISVLLIIGIFLFKNLRLQMRITLLTALLMCVLGAVTAIILYRNSPVAHIEWTGATLLLLCAVVLTVGAYRLMRRDHNLLRSADRLR